jgi:anti-sigma B factor antagonist
MPNRHDGSSSGTDDPSRSESGYRSPADHHFLESAKPDLDVAADHVVAPDVVVSPLHDAEPDAASAFTITSTCDADGTAVVTVVGEVDLATSPALRTRLLELLLNNPRVIVVRLDQVPLLDSTGLTALLAVHRRASLLGVELRLAGPAPSPSKVLRITGLDEPFAVYPTLTDALRASKAGGDPPTSTTHELADADADAEPLTPRPEAS